MRFLKKYKMKYMHKYIILILLTSFSYSMDSLVMKKDIRENEGTFTITATIYLEQNIDDVFNTLADFSNLTKHIDSIDKLELYYEDDGIKKFKLTTNIFFIFAIENHLSFKIDKANYRITSSLDKEKDNHIKDSQSEWELKRIANNRTKVLYSASIQYPQFLPKILSTYLLNQSFNEYLGLLVEND